MIAERGNQSAKPALGGPLDVIAYAGWQVLGAERVAVAVAQGSARDGEDTETTVRGSYGSASQPLHRRRIVLAPEIPLRAVAAVDLENRSDGSVRLSMGCPGRANLDEPGLREGAAQLLRDRTVDQLEIAILVQLPDRDPREGIAQSLSALLDAAVEAVTVERASFRQRLSFGLQEREEERRRWARELHDETLQEMGALQVLLTSALRSGQVAAERTAAVLEVLPTATDMLNRQITGLRHLITELRPATLDELGLSAPLQALARRTEELTGLRVDLHVALRYADGQMSTRLLPDIEVAVYRVVQEALTNASRHSGGTHIQVSVVEDDHDVHVKVLDDGNGISQASAAPGFGIVGMQERAALANGHVEVLAATTKGWACDQRGTLVHLVVPATHRLE